jgi:hypothetical protein
MPDHWHALFALREPWTLPKFMRDMMSFVGARTAALRTAPHVVAKKLLLHSRKDRRTI